MKIINGENMIKKDEKQEVEKLERELNEAYGLIAGIKLYIDEYHRIQEDFSVEPIDELTLIANIYEQIEQKLPKKYLIAEKLELDDKEQKILEALRKKH